MIAKKESRGRKTVHMQYNSIERSDEGPLWSVEWIDFYLELFRDQIIEQVLSF